MYARQTPSNYININLREVGALPEDSSRGVGAVEVPEKRRAAGRYLGRLGGDLIVSVILVLSAHLATPGTPPGGSQNAKCLLH